MTDEADVTRPGGDLVMVMVTYVSGRTAIWLARRDVAEDVLDDIRDSTKAREVYFDVVGNPRLVVLHQVEDARLGAPPVDRGLMLQLLGALDPRVSLQLSLPELPPEAPRVEPRRRAGDDDPLTAALGSMAAGGVRAGGARG